MKVKELLKKESKWTQCHFAENKQGFDCSPKSPNAAKFCLVGAVQKCYPERNDRRKIYRKLHSYLQSNDDFMLSCGYGDFKSYNDNTLIYSFNDDFAKFPQVKNLVNKLDI